MGKSKWDGYDYKNNYDSSISYDEPSSYRTALEYGYINNDLFRWVISEPSYKADFYFLESQNHKIIFERATVKTFVRNTVFSVSKVGFQGLN